MSHQRTSIVITGMHCTSCAARTANALKKTQGVEDANVNFATGKASVLYDPAKVTEQKLIAAVKGAGYSAAMAREVSPQSLHHHHHGHILDYKNRFVAAAIFSVPLLLTMVLPLLPQSSPPILLGLRNGMGLLGFLLATPVQFWIGWPFYKSAWSALRNKTTTMDTLVVLGTTTAYIYSAVNFSLHAISEGSVFGDFHHLYFEVSALLITFVLLGKWLEAHATGATSQAVEKLMKLEARTARVQREGDFVDVPLSEVRVGDIVMVRPGETIPVDGMVTKGSTAIDESMLTGESIPVEKTEGKTIFGGTMNGNGSIEFRAEKVGSDTAIARIIRLVEEAQGSKAPLQDFADRVSAWFVPAVLILAFMTLGGWLLLGTPVTFALLAFVSVLVIACPCALGLATPTAIMVAVGKGAELGILIRGGGPLEAARAIDTIIFDKTGTITRGKPEVTDVLPIKTAGVPALSYKLLLHIAASLEQHSEHAVGESILNEARKRNVAVAAVPDFKAIPGKGVEGTVQGKHFFLGNRALMRSHGVAMSEGTEAESHLQEQGKTVVLLGHANRVIGIIAVADTIKPTASEAIKEVRALGLHPVMITGDNAKTAKAIAKEAGIDDVLAEVLPEDKANEIARLQKEGRKVAMVGDGINDSPGLAQSDLGIVMGNGTDIAMETGGIILVKSDPRDVVTAIRLSRAAVRKIHENLFFALFYNVLGIPIAARLLSPIGLILRPELAGLAMALSSVSVVSNALLLRRFEPGKSDWLSAAAPFLLGMAFTFFFVIGAL